MPDNNSNPNVFNMFFIVVVVGLEADRKTDVDDAVVGVVRGAGLQVGVPQFEGTEREQVHAGEIDAHVLHGHLLGDVLGQRIADFEVFQAHVAAVGHPERGVLVVVVIRANFAILISFYICIVFEK